MFANDRKGVKVILLIAAIALVFVTCFSGVMFTLGWGRSASKTDLSGMDLEYVKKLTIEVPSKSGRSVTLASGPAGYEGRVNEARLHGSELYIRLGQDNLFLQLPVGKLSDVSIDTVGGAIRIEGLDVDGINVSSVSGDITVKDTRVHGSLEAESASGSVTLDRVDARDIEVDTVSGSVKWRGNATDSASIDSISGSIKAEAGTTKDIDIDTTSGSIAVLTENHMPEIKFDTISGSLTAERAAKGEHDMRISVDSISGSLAVYTTDEGISSIF